MTGDAPSSRSPEASPLWTAAEIVAATSAEARGLAPDAAITGVSIDTRTLRPGELFVALAGDNRDGHDFVEDALAKGAGAALVARSAADRWGADARLFAVDDPLEALAALGRAARARLAPEAQVVAVTGSVGKTGTKEALRVALAALFGADRVHAAVASYNNHWGVPLTLARMPCTTRAAVIEIGMNHPFEILPLTALARPHAAVITTVAPVHLAAFREERGIADAKGEIFAGLEPGGVAVLPRDSVHFERLRAHAVASRAGRVVTFGEHEAAAMRLKRLIGDLDGSSVEARLYDHALVYRVGTPGRHVAINSLAVLATVGSLGGDLALAGLSLGGWTPPAGRGARETLAAPGGEITLIDESYNANPASMRAALDNLAQMPKGLRGRRIAVLGDMLELGPTARDHHAALHEAVEAAEVDLVFASGSLMGALWNELPPERRGAHAPDAETLRPHVLAALRAGDVVTVKGSLGSRMGPVVKAIRERFRREEEELARPRMLGGEAASASGATPREPA